MAVSGGMDSIVLAHVLKELGWNVQLAHVNYGLRGTDAIADCELVQKVAIQWGVPFFSIDVSGQKPTAGSVQEWARNVRYEWFSELSRDVGVQHVLVAHHADDQLETILLNLGRGTGLSGLKGMSASRSLGENSVLVRPLLNVSREEIRVFAVHNGLEWREDASNLDVRYARNEVRAELAQMERGEYREFLESGMTLSRRVRDFYDSQMAPLQALNSKSLSIEYFAELPQWLSGWLVLEYVNGLDPNAPRRKSVVRSIRSLALSKPGKAAQFGDVRVCRDRKELVFTTTRDNAHDDGSEWNLPNLNHPFHQATQHGTLHGSLPPMPYEPPLKQGPNVALLDADKLLQPIVLRKWRDGDRFHPLGLGGSQKIKSFLTNTKVPPSRKRDVYVVEAGRDIVWVVGNRIDDRFKVTSSTTRLARFYWEPKLTRETA